MDESESTRIQPRKSSTASKRSSLNETRKPASIYEINELYSALHDLVRSSPHVEKRRLRAATSNIDSSDGTSGTDSPDIRSRMMDSKRNNRIIRSSSSITTRSQDLDEMRETERRPRLSTPELHQRKLPNRMPQVSKFSTSTSPKLALKKSRSDAPRLRSKSSFDNSNKTMTEKIREQRLRFTDALRRREKEEENLFVVDGKVVKDIDDLLEMARFSPKQERKEEKKKHSSRRRGSSLLKSSKKATSSDSNLRSLDVTSRINEWYDRASAKALVMPEDESYESFSGSESEDTYDHEKNINTSLKTINFNSDIPNHNQLLDKWMGQKKTRLTVEERGRSGSESSYEPASTDEAEPSIGSIVQEDVNECDCKNTKDIHTVTSIIISQASIDASTDEVKNNETANVNLPNQPIFYIPNISEDEAKPTVIDNSKKQLMKSPQPASNRPRSRSAISANETQQQKTGVQAEVQEQMRKCRSLGIERRGSMDQIGRRDKKEKVFSCNNEYHYKHRPRSLHLSPNIGKKQNRPCKINEDFDENISDIQFTNDDHITVDTNKNEKKQDKSKKFTKLSNVPGKIKTFLSGKKS